MERKIKQMVSQFRQERKRRLRITAGLTALSVLVSGGVYWQMHLTGTAMTAEPLCGMEEHIHTDECYRDVLLSETDTGPPDDTSPQRELICSLEEHTHGELCYPDISADTETAADWEAKLPACSEVMLRRNVYEIAKSQIGYAESTRNFKLAQDGTTHSGYTRYGEWYGNAYGPWNTFFTYFCLNYAGVAETGLPVGGSCTTWARNLEKADLLRKPEAGIIPARGNVVFLDADADGQAERSAIVSGSKDGSISLIEGDSGDCVCEKSYQWDDPVIFGWLEIPQPTLPAQEFEGETASGVKVRASAAEDIFPAGTEMKVRDASLQEVWGDAAVIGRAETILDEQVAVDIAFYDAQGNEIEPADSLSVQVKIDLPEDLKLSDDPEAEPSLLHIQDDGSATLMEEAIVTTEGAEFETESFSLYLVTELGDIEKDHIRQNANGSFVDNSEANPFYMFVGQTVKIAGKTTSTNSQYGNLYLPNTDVLQEVGAQATNGERRERSYRAVNPGRAEIVIDLDGNNRNFAHFYVQVFQNNYYPINVKTALDDRNIDKVNEYLEVVAGAGELKTDDGYIPNAYRMNGSDHSLKRIYPYMLSSGQTATFYNPIPEGGNIQFTAEKIDSEPAKVETWLDGIRDKGSAPVTGDQFEMVQTVENGIATVTVKPKEPGYYRMKFVQNGMTLREFYVQCIEENKDMTHADIEISDGGKYTITETTVDGDRRETIMRVYDATISSVNDCFIYDASGEIIRNYHGSVFPPYDDGVYKPGDYVNISLESQSTQFEWSSQPDYFRIFSGRDRDEPGKPRYYSYDAADEVVFDVQLQLTPNYEEYKLVEVFQDGAWVPQGDWTPVPWSGESDKIDIDHMLYPLHEQDMIDAHNKCPDHSGMDFTARSSAAMLRLKTRKELTGMELAAGKFNFEIVDKDDNDRVVASATNDADGNIAFNPLRFENLGTYHYELRESLNVNNATEEEKALHFDTRTYPLDLEVKELTPGSGSYFIEILSDVPDTFIFHNAVPYTLPETGGTGTLPYTAGGVILITAAVLLPLKCRRKEDAQDS